MAKVTYLFGAGASCKCLPLVTEIPTRLQSFLDYVEGRSYEADDMFAKKVGYADITVYDMYVNFIRDGKEIVKEVQQHQSIDTYAKKLRITAPTKSGSGPQYDKLKAILTCLFMNK